MNHKQYHKSHNYTTMKGESVDTQTHCEGENCEDDVEQNTTVHNTTNQAALVSFADDVIAGLERRRKPEE